MALDEQKSSSLISTRRSGFLPRNIDIAAQDIPKTQLIHNTRLNIYNSSSKIRNTEIICTIGPSSRSVEMLKKLMNAGMNVVRMNFSHGTHEYHTGTCNNAKEAAKELGRDIAIALDTKGPEIRTGNFKDNKEYYLETGKKVRITINDKHKNDGDEKQFYIDYINIIKVVKKGDEVYIDDGLVSLRVEEIGEDYLDTTVVNSGMVSNHKGVNLPNVNVDLPALSDRDKLDLQLGVKLEVDYIFASFIRRPEDVIEIRKVLMDADKKIGQRISIISKIENHQGVRNFDDILRVTDGIMVARGDLGIEIPAEKVFLAQKMMIAKCNIMSKPIIVATQMLESMTNNPRPTRAEATDVANAVLDGADCVMLSGETAKGKYPIETVTMMDRICREAESAINRYQYFTEIRNSLPSPLPTEEVICCSAVLCSFEQRASAIIVLTNTGGTARLIAKFRPPCPIITVTGETNRAYARQLEISSGVFSTVYDDSKGKKDADDRIRIGLEFGKNKGFLQDGDIVICVHADTMGKGFANLVRVLSL